MTASRTILYLGTYEQDYPRNQQLIRLFRRVGCRVVEAHQPFWERYTDKSRGVAGIMGKLLALATLLRSYLLLLLRSIGWIGHADAVVIGYIGQVDMLVLAPLFRLSGIPVLFNPLVTLTDTIVEDRKLVPDDSLAAGAVHAVDCLALKLATAVIVDTPENASYLRDRFGVASDRVWVIDVGADESVFNGGRELRATPDPLHVLFYGKMIPLHGIDVILAAIERLEARNPSRFCFEIIGQGQLEHRVEAFLERCPDAPIVYRPWVAYRRLPQRIASADVVLGVFGAGEKAGRVVPNKVYQAMAMGAPIVTRDAPAVRRVLAHEHSAMLVPAGDPDALADAVEQLRDADLRDRLGQNARAAFERWGSDSALSDSVAEMLDRVVPAGDPKPRPERST